jgi:tyrosyl-tRNA synthetase
MMQRDSVRERLHNREQGISYTEFSYMILQAYDYLHLRRAQGVTVQMGGSDQWGNIVSGCDLIRRTFPMGKRQLRRDRTACDTQRRWQVRQNRVRRDLAVPERTSPYAFYQFWLNTDDGDLLRYLRLFTFFSVEEISRATGCTKKIPAPACAPCPGPSHDRACPRPK